MEALLGALLGGGAYRIRGGGIDYWFKSPVSNFWLRGVWALFVTLSLAPHIKPEYLPAFFVAAYIGVLFGYWGGEFNLRKPENRTVKNYRTLTLRGMFIMLPVALLSIPLALQQPWYGVAAGALFVPCYLLGDNVLNKYVKLNCSEWLLGAVLGVALCL